MRPLPGVVDEATARAGAGAALATTQEFDGNLHDADGGSRDKDDDIADSEDPADSEDEGDQATTFVPCGHDQDDAITSPLYQATDEDNDASLPLPDAGPGYSL